MADKTTTLKTQTGDNVYPNVLDKNIPDSIVRGVELNAVQENLNNKIYEIANSMKGEIDSKQNISYSHFITITNSNDGIALYLTIQNITNTSFTADMLASYLAGKKVLANGNLHGLVPTYIAGEGGTIKVYYRTPGDSDINPPPDEFVDLSSFAISDLVNPVE